MRHSDIFQLIILHQLLNQENLQLTRNSQQKQQSQCTIENITMSIFLNIRKIGKTKHKFKAKITFLKLINDATEKGLCFKVKIERGAHEIEAVSQPSRKGTSRFANAEYIIPMTLFYDDDEKQPKYLQKEATIKVYECDESGEQKKRLGTKTIDLSEFANKGQLKMQIQIEGDKKIDNPKLTLQLFLERQEDDSKSVETYSNNNDARNDADLDGEIDKKKKRDKAQKSENKSPVSSNNVGSQGKRNVQQDRTAKGDQKEIERNEVVNDIRPKKRDKSPVPVKKYEQEQKRKYQTEPSQTVQSTRAQSQYTINAPKEQKQVDAKKTDKEQSEISEFANRKKSIQTEFNDGQSPQMQVFLLKKALRDKQSECVSMKRQNQALRKTIDKMVEEASTAKQLQKRTGIQREVEDMRKALTAKDIIIDNLTTNSKASSTRQEEYQKTIVRLRQQLLSSKQKISDMKYRQAFMMQELFETANKEALEQASRFLSI